MADLSRGSALDKMSWISFVSLVESCALPRTFVLLAAIAAPLAMRYLRRSLAQRISSGAKTWAAWVSVDPRTGNITVYECALARIIESAHQRKDVEVELKPWLTGATVVFKPNGNHVQQTGPGRVRDVRRVELSGPLTDGHKGPSYRVSLQVCQPRHNWKISDGRSGGEEELRAAPVFQDDAVCVEDCGSMDDEAMRASRERPNAAIGRVIATWEKLRGQRPQWEWCHQTGVHYTDASIIPLEDWGVYTPDQNKMIECAYLAGDSDVQVEVGVRRFKVVFIARGFAKQEDVENRARRLVRRRLVADVDTPVAELTSDTDNSCSLCLLDFSETVTMPVWSLPCGHTFHQACAQPLSIRGAPCPLCRCEIDWATLRGET